MRSNAGTPALYLLMLALAACTRGGPDTQALLDPNSGGATTVSNATHRAFAQPAANLDVQRRGQFFIGNAFFNSPWVVAPATAGARDGLGPLFNARSCDACHNNDGRGRPPERPDERPISLVIQFATPVPGDNNEPGADPRYGGNLNPFAIGGVPAEGTVRIRHKEIHGTFSDGEPYTLLAPEYEFADLAYGELAHDNQFSPRVAPPVFGMGLLEAIPDSQILERADPDDADGDGISGRPNHVWNHLLSRAVIGRLGWKSNQPDVAHQTAGAFSSEIGMSSSLRPEQNCTPVQKECLAAPTGGEPEISDEIFAHIVDYQQMLGVPARRSLDSPQVKRGARLFLEAGCESCHRATFTTPESNDKPWLSRQTIHPFTDLLLHDMGPGLADGRADFEASGSEWRTAPLWGIGLQQIVNGHTLLLHDGRARNVSEAILWHDGEGAKSKQAFLGMSKADREALLAFVNSL
ncbi:MAG TPA: di-heme oxidoredictase family protein [Povalibacter sp.]|uniref:di-heme oxidoreductase family protein n=1 Tax=Povalibacter sp. TaxID=1962978 RepID=UPI002C1E04C3|nr:di-heme oxidoredictase family protein [Povalibacter sp.]HMN45610.1 di-heme oxidoredictase family protein [Povalibacter sp.]